MKDSVKKFFLLGLGVAAAGIAAGVAYKHRGKIKKAVDELVKKSRLTAEEGEKLAKDLVAEIAKVEKKVVKKVKKK